MDDQKYKKLHNLFYFKTIEWIIFLKHLFLTEASKGMSSYVLNSFIKNSKNFPWIGTNNKYWMDEEATIITAFYFFNLKGNIASVNRGNYS